MVYASGQWHLCQKWKQSGKRKEKIQKVNILGVFLSLMFDNSSASLNGSLFHFAPAAALSSAQLQKF